MARATTQRRLTAGRIPPAAKHPRLRDLLRERADYVEQSSHQMLMMRSEAANEHQPAATVAAYSHLLIAALTLQSSGQAITPLRSPKWRDKEPTTHPSTGDLL